ncbi:adenylyl-sulfate kinase [Actinoplanes sp. NPDC051851]|uniref:adenylyl-sulfate kinase n=1 Tax=Actinoplanes sp. NPDC051851 TaxID=3154753 RepID=UPI0034191BD3
MDQPAETDVRALLITGTVGSGKTTTAAALGDLLAAAGIANAVLDVDWLRRSWPSPPGDPFNRDLTLRNLRDVARNVIEAGALRLVLAGVIESRAERDDYRAALGVPLTVCRLHVPLATVHDRLTGRHTDDAAGLRWHLDRSRELDRVFDQADVEDVTVDATADSAREVARAVRAAVHW